MYYAFPSTIKLPSIQKQTTKKTSKKTNLLLYVCKWGGKKKRKKITFRKIWAIRDLLKEGADLTVAGHKGTHGCDLTF